MTKHWMIVAALLALLSAAGLANAAPDLRPIPQPLPSHPGNIFLAGEQVIVVAPAHAAQAWRAVDYDGTTVAQGQSDEHGQVRLGQLPIGCYEVHFGAGDGTGRVSLGVLQPLRAPTPRSSPIAIDVAMAWFFTQERMAAPANLCALAGVNWVRDRLAWPELEPQRGQFASSTRYEASAQAQSAAGLQVLQVGHASPAWANPNTKRFPLDLRDIYRFHRELARRWQGQVAAIEPWNEADIDVFGGHTGTEMASLQKAAYLGLKAGNPKTIACLNVFAIHRASTLHNFDANQAWPYFDTYNLHCYEPLQNYPAVFADHRAISAGKPMWVTEVSVRVKWQEGDPLKELSPEDARLQGERLTKTFALALHQGAAEVFYFMLPHYPEGVCQFGLLHGDLTPQPGYLALAAVGRLLADAKPLGRVEIGNKAGQAYFFSAKPGGKPADVVVAWAQTNATLELPAPPRACYDHLGRAVPVTGRMLNVGSAPLFAILPRRAYPSLIPPPKPAKLLPGKPSPLVLQALLPDADVVVKESAYKFGTARTKVVPVFLYNFGDRKSSGRLAVAVPDGWTAEFSRAVEVAPGERKELTLTLTKPDTNPWTECGLRITGDFGRQSHPVLALRLVPE